MYASLEPKDLPVLESADAGDAEAQNDLALIFLSNGKHKDAIYWLELAAKQDYAIAMHGRGRCHIDGNWLPTNNNRILAYELGPIGRENVLRSNNFLMVRHFNDHRHIMRIFLDRLASHVFVRRVAGSHHR
jgi:TPR repeat protein